MFLACAPNIFGKNARCQKRTFILANMLTSYNMLSFYCHSHLPCTHHLNEESKDAMPTHIKVLVNNVKGTRGCEFLQPNTSLFAKENVRTSRAHLFRPRFEQHRLIIIGILMTSAKNQSNKDLVEKKGKHHLHNEHDHGNPKECIDTVLQGGTMSQADRRLHFLHSSLAVIGRTVLS